MISAKSGLLTGIFFIALGLFTQGQTPGLREPEGELAVPPSKKGWAPDIWKDGIRLNFNERGTRFLRVTFMGQLWVRHIENNPGTLFFGEPKKSQTDISLRRVRMQFMVQPHERWFIYSQFGINNFNYATARKPSFFLHDFTIEYMPVDRYLYIGGGLGSWGTSSRFGASGIGSIMGLDIPVYQEPLNDLTDQFVRQLGLYAKGSLHRLNYRVALNKPFAVHKSEGFDAANAIAAYSLFSPRDPKPELAGYLEWNFMQQETDKTPYKAGTHLGSMRVLNLGAGARYQPRALWHRTAAGDTAYSPMIMGTVDVFAELPFKKDGQTFYNLYGAYTYADFGPGYLRQVGPNGIATGSSLPASPLYGTGNSAPVFGTGHSLYFQGGLLTPALRKTELRFMPYASALVADYRVIKKPVTLYEAGLNLIIKGNALKLTAGWQNRPFFETAAGAARRLNMGIIQMQFSI